MTISFLSSYNPPNIKYKKNIKSENLLDFALIFYT